MKLWRNPELRLPLLLSLGGALLFTGIGFSLDFRAGLLLAAASLFFFAVFLLTTYRRYRALADLSQTVDRILHGTRQSLIPENSREGELAILYSEIRKMTVRLEKQAEGLQNDKQLMCDAIADISHQLRTPLTSMNLTVSLLGQADLPPEKRVRLLRELAQRLTQVDWLIETLLKAAKLDAGTAQLRTDPVPVAELIRRASEPLLIPMELRGQTLSVSVGQEQFTGDLPWSTEAIGNLLKNCMEHTPEGGRITVAARETSLFTEITVSDTGRGFEKEDLPHLFERFYKGKNAAAESVGIGLALARMVIAEQNGTIRAFNPPGGGACFAVRFYKGTV